jgi:hypothetical protein
MFCPVCRGEYREGFTFCSDCDVALVAELPRDPDGVDFDAEVGLGGDDRVHPDGDLVRVFSTGEAALIPVVQSLLDDAGIGVMTKGEPVQDIFALGRLFGANSAVGPVEFFVRPDQADEAARLLEGLGEPLAEDAENPGTGATEP